jgi:hypothetical protein
VHRMQNGAKEKLQLLQSAHLKQSAGLAETLRDVSLEYLRYGSEAERLRSIGLLLGPDVQELLRRSEEHVALASGNYLRLLPQCFGGASIDVPDGRMDRVPPLARDCDIS